MASVLVLGAGLVAKPVVRYLLENDINVTVATRTISKAEDIIGGHPNGEAVQFTIDQMDTLKSLISNCDLAISLLPYVHHVTVAKECINQRKHMVTTSYVSDAMSALDKKARDAGVIILNEIGLDPGIDHMSAMRIIHKVRRNGGRIEDFYSYCGGLPAPEANTNPFGYKFSWSPRGVVLASKNGARYLKNGKEIVIEPKDLFTHYWKIYIDKLGEFEAYPNRDSIPYIEKYGLEGISTMYRGTLRCVGWCDTWKKFVDLGILDDKKIDTLKNMTYRQMVAYLLGVSEHDVEAGLREKLNVPADVLERFKWLGLLDDKKISTKAETIMDAFIDILLEKLQYSKGERDMIILRHEFTARYGERKEKIISTLIDFGVVGEETSMARTVGLPAAIASRLILEGTINENGVKIPVIPEIYEDVMDELSKFGIIFKEETL